MRSSALDSLINRYPPEHLLTKVKNRFRRMQLIKPQFLPTPKQVYGVGLLADSVEALTKALGPAGMARFMQQFEMGSGDYTRDRDEILGNPTVDEIFSRIEKRRNPTIEEVVAEIKQMRQEDKNE